MFARVSTIATPPGKLEQTMRVQREVAPMAAKVPGSKGVYLLLDTASSKGVAITFWESKQALEGSREQANRIRADAVGKIGGLVLSVEEYEVIVQT